MGQFRPGETVRVLSTSVETHHRTPAYVKGKTGLIRALSGSFRDPETSAYGESGLRKRALYLVEFGMRDLWGEAYGGSSADTLVVDIYEQWLEPVNDLAGLPG